MGMRTVLLGLVVLSIQPRVFAQSPPFQNSTAETGTSSLGAQVTDDASTTESGSPYITPAAGQADAAAFKGGGQPGDYCATLTKMEYCTVTESACPGQGQTTYVSRSQLPLGNGLG